MEEEGTIFSNVTTESARWDVAGKPVGSGDSDKIVLPFGQPLEQPSARGSIVTSSAVQPLSIGDSWIESVRQVRFHRHTHCWSSNLCVAAVLTGGCDASSQPRSSR